LRELRRDMGLTVREASEAIGVAKGTLVAAERARREPYPRTMKKIADFYGLKPSSIWPVSR
jgi:transcriptional regulator with XRE-family HTH domain